MRLLRHGRFSHVAGSLAAVPAIAGVVFWVAYDSGSYGSQSRGVLAIALWWAAILAIAFRLVAVERIPRSAVLVGSLLALLAAWTLLSAAWAPSVETVVEEFNRVSLYLGVFALTVALSSRLPLGRWLDGLAVGVAAVAVVSLVSRLVPGSFPSRGLPTFLPTDVTRLSFPLGYWNGLAVFVAFGVPLLLRAAVVSRSALARSLAVAPLPAMAAVVYLTSSRGGVAAAAVGALVFLGLAERRWQVAGALACALAGSAAAVVVLVQRHELVDGPLGTERVRSQGLSAAVLVAAACLATAVAYGAGTRLLTGRVRAGPRAAAIALVACLVAAGIGIGLADPVGAVRTFTRSPSEVRGYDDANFVRAHLLSVGGSGRWQFWSSAVEQWTHHDPLLGEGAGSFEQWWAQHAPFTYFIRDAHSLYLESLGELGVVGFALVVALVGAGTATALVRARRTAGELRTGAAAAAAVVVSYAIAAGLDWMWEMTAVTVVGFVALALASGPALAQPPPARLSAVPAPSPRPRLFGLGVAALAVAWALLLFAAVPVLAQRAVARSEAAVRAGDLDRALDAALDARDIEPWAATPYAQLALVRERQGHLASARRWIAGAVSRDRLDWRLWLVQARIEAKLGQTLAAARSLERAASLNPRSPLFGGLGLPGGRG